MIAFAALLLAVAPAPAKASVAGNYETHQMEMAGALELKRDGHFRYAFSYGALDEEAAGDWSFDGRAVHLKLEDPGFEWGHPLYALATDMKQTFEIEADEDGRVDLAGKPTVLAIAPMIPVFGPTRDTFKLAADRGHRLLFRFHRNDLGKADFRDERLDIGPKGLLMKRYDAEIRFIRVRP
jgi:hypothetical protein